MVSNISAFLSNGENVAFFICALLAIGGAIFMINFTRVVHMVLALAMTFVSLAGLYVVLRAEFVAVVQILIYAGAISILMIFGIMMTKHKGDIEEEPNRPWHNGLLFVGAAGLFGLIFYCIQTTQLQSGELPEMADNTLEIGKQLFSLHVIPFELMSVLLTVAFIGAIVVAKKEED
ncbi:NADH-quinone oxidoreductase subunit J [Paenibacillus sp. YYML68]|uniref:NADH-quinone oxidoreductase subunit J n=1 Tax=Paenibacillus sp. YYML68 TaxID=2909250 RepID=UPI002490B01E|nr:NADH-quinone oxidoreductase subunit J [Paenibacillus sp. YYML68]